MYGRQSDNESIYWTKSLNQENVEIVLEESPEDQEVLYRLLMYTFWNKWTPVVSGSSIKQTPLALMYCFQRLQHSIRGGMTALLQFVELAMNEQSMDLSRNRISWDVVCWAFGLNHKQDRLCLVTIPFNDVNSFLSDMRKQCKRNCRLRLEYSASSSKEEVLSLFQYDAIGEYFQVPILESAWKAIPENATVSIIDSDNDKSSSTLHWLRMQKVQVKRVGKVTATYNQSKQTDAPTDNSDQFLLICLEDAEKYQLPKLLGKAEEKAAFHLTCQWIVSDSRKRMAGESTSCTTDDEMQCRFSCAVDFFEINDDDEDHFQAILYKQKTLNIGRTALPFRLIDDSELSLFTCGQDIKRYLEETMICDLMFCSPTDIESRAKALKGQDLLTDDAFVALRVVIEQLWQLGSQKDRDLRHTVRLDIEKQRESAEVLILDVEGYYMYRGLPLVRMTFVDIERNGAAVETNKETTTIYHVKSRRCIELLKKMLCTNSLRMSQERLTLVKWTAPFSTSLITFLQMVFVNGNGDAMASELHRYPLNTSLVDKYIEKIYSDSIRQNFVARIKATEILEKQMKNWMSLSARAPHFPSEANTHDSTMTRNSSSLPQKQQTSCSVCKKLTTNLKKCSRCKSDAYCSKECQVKDWSTHMKSCSSAELKNDERSTNDQNIAAPAVPVGPESAEVCLCCRLGKPNLKKCTKCKSAAYCSQECQLADWKRHKTECQTQQPPSASPLMNRCSSCGVLGNEMKKCSQCKSAIYCSIECQRTDWKNHKTTCQRP